ncbi:hypothetical protein AAFF_G00402190 [Aldrovandia affinis]|uniref:Uncharacterized protein n=1 Tax=Aldrovandia affinis TaxID=143900 RepID=A0AAD7X072_9TELE|nr:hypothetical protein AAFF_G00402190 [Aldrovandia affinis]
MYEPKFSCRRTKCDAIVTNVLTPWANDEVKRDLDNVEFGCLSMDASNHGHLRLLPILDRYCKLYDGTTSAEIKPLDFVELRGETAKQIASEILSVMHKFNLENKVVAFSADNTNTNFGGLNQIERQNVHTKVKAAVQREVIGLGCPAHIMQHVFWLEMEKAVETVQTKCPAVTINEDALFDEVIYLNAYVKGAMLAEWSAAEATVAGERGATQQRG